MKPALRYSLYALAIIAFAVLTGVLVHLSRRQGESLSCTAVAVHFKDPFNFVTEDDIKDYLTKYYGPYLGQKLDGMALSRMEKMLDTRSAVLKSEAWTDRDGTLNISITQRQPVVRFQKGDGGFYVDDRGCVFPLQRGYTSRVPVVDGDIPLDVPAGYKGEIRSDSGKEWLESLLAMLRGMGRSRTWSSNIVQIHVRTDGDLVLIPREGRERFIFGDPSHAKQKFDRMADYYRYIKPSREDGYYGSVNVKYDGQIVCRK